MWFNKKEKTPVEKYDTDFIKEHVFNHKGRITYTSNDMNEDISNIISDASLFNGNTITFFHENMWIYHRMNSLNISLVELINQNINSTVNLGKILFDQIREFINNISNGKKWIIHILTNPFALSVLNSKFEKKIKEIETYFFENYIEFLKNHSEKTFLSVEYKKGYPIIESSKNIFLE